MRAGLIALAMTFWLLLLTQVQALPYEIVQDTFNHFNSLQAQEKYIIGSKGAQAGIWDRNNLRQKRTLTLAPEQTTQVLPNGQTLTIQHDAPDCDIDFYQGQLISACQHHPGLQFWDLDSGERLSDLKQVDYSWTPEQPGCANTSPQYRRVEDIAIRTRLQPILKVWDTHKKLHFQAEQPSPILKMASSKQWIALVLLDQSLRIYDLKTGHLHWQYQLQGTVGDISLDGDRLALSTREQEISIWDLPSRQQKQLIKLAKLKGFHALTSEQTHKQKVMPTNGVGVGSIANSAAACHWIMPSQLKIPPFPFQEIALSAQHLFGLFQDKLYVLDLDQHTLNQIPLPAQHNNALLIQAQLQFVGEHLFIWNEADSGQRDHFQAYHPQTQVWFQHVSENIDTHSHNQMLAQANGEHFDFPQSLKGPNYLSDIKLAGPEISYFSGSTHETQISAGYTIAEGSDLLLEIWNLKQRRLLRELVLPYPPKQIELNPYALALGYQVLDQPAVQLYYPPQYKISQWLDGPPQNEYAHSQDFRLQEDTLMMAGRPLTIPLRIWKLPETPAQPLRPLKEITPTSETIVTQADFDKQVTVQIWPGQTNLPETQGHFSLTSEEIKSWQITPTGLWVIQAEPVNKGAKLYLYAYGQTTPDLFATLPDFESILRLSPDDLIYTAKNTVYRLDLKSGLKQVYVGSKNVDISSLSGQWLIGSPNHQQERFLHIWNLDNPEQHKQFSLTDSLELIGEQDDHLFFERVIYPQMSTADDQPRVESFSLDLTHSSSQLQTEASVNCNSKFIFYSGNYVYFPWVNSIQKCARTNQHNQIEISKPGIPAQPVFQLDPEYDYHSLSFLTNKWLLLDEYTTKQPGTSLVNLEQQQQTHLPGELKSTHSSRQSETLSFRPIDPSQPDFELTNDQPSQYLTISKQAFHKIKTLTQFKVHFFPHGVIVIAPDGHYAGWGDYQKYLHFADAQGQMIPWPEAERRWHKPQLLQQRVTSLLTQGNK